MSEKPPPVIDPDPPTLVHYANPPGSVALCTLRGTVTIVTSDNPAAVNCFSCRRKLREGGRDTDPLPQRVAPKSLRQIMDETPEVKRLRDDVLKACRNERGMYVIEEFIHHGDYRSKRRVEVYEVNRDTVNAVIESSAYCYGSFKKNNSWADVTRNEILDALVQDLRALRTNRTISWSTFRIITPGETS